MEQTLISCVPYAGAGATFYRNWPPAPNDSLALEPVQLPGREERFAEDPYRSIDEAVADISATVARTTHGRAFALFGHSFGAILAFEVARSLCTTGQRPTHLLVSGSADPGSPVRRQSAELADDAFVAQVEQLAGYTHPALANPELRELVLPALRADVNLHESYRPTSNSPIPVPVTVFHGVRDHLVSAADCDRWSGWTTERYQRVDFDGGHMYLAEDPEAVLAAIADVLG